MKPITICFAYYRNLGMLQEQCKRLAALPDDLKAYLNLIVVDDGSALPQGDEKEVPEVGRAAEWQDIGLPFELYRMDVNIRWNQDACRNLAVEQAKTDWLLLLDIDHIPPPKTLASLVNGKHEPERAYGFRRLSMDKKRRIKPYKPHPNSWFISRDLFWRMGGYDERFAGYYGTDGEFRERLLALAGPPIETKDVIIRVPREAIPDASTTTYERKGKVDANLGNLRRQRNITPGWQPMHFRFPWTRVA